VVAVSSLSELPEVLTIEEAAAVLRISRAAAYEQARLYRLTDGAEGLPVVALGRTLRVPRAAIEQLLTVEPPARPVLRVVRGDERWLPGGRH